MSGFIIAGEAVSKPTMAAPATSTTAGNLRVAEPTGVAQPGTRGGMPAKKQSSPSRPVLLRVKRKRGEDPVRALIIQESIKLPRTVNSLANALNSLGAPSDTAPKASTANQDERALLLFRKLGTVPADRLGVDQRQASKLVRKFIKLEKAASRSNARKTRKQGEGISWYEEKTLAEKGKTLRARDKRNSTKEKRSDLLSQRRKERRALLNQSAGGDVGVRTNLDEVFEVMDVEPKKKRIRMDDTRDATVQGGGAGGEQKPAAKSGAGSLVALQSTGKGSRILTPVEKLMDAAIYRSFQGGPGECDLILEALRQGGNANYARSQADNTTAIMAASLHGRGDVVVQLMKAGCDIACIDASNRSPLDFARLGKHLDVETELKLQGGLGGAAIVSAREKERERLMVAAGKASGNDYVYDFYYLRGVAEQDDGGQGGMQTSDGSQLSLTDTDQLDSSVLNITSKYESKFRRARDGHVAFDNVQHLLTDAGNEDTNLNDISDDDMFMVESDLDEHDTDDSNAEDYYANSYPAEDPDICFTSGDEYGAGRYGAHSDSCDDGDGYNERCEMIHGEEMWY